MPSTIPVTHLVLYKHGVGTFTRNGVVGGVELELPFRSSEVDDALKSLVVQPLNGGQVLSVRYATPLNRAEALAELPIELGQKHSLFDLLRCLRGTPVEVHLDGAGSVAGRVVGVEEHPQGREFGATLVLLTGDSSLQQIATDRIVQVQLADGRVAAALGQYLDTVSADESSRDVRVTLTEPGREVRVIYTIPSPVWRVSYRVVAETKGDDRRALLQGWAIFDNRMGEDLENVEVTLVAGQPVSFRYDLTSSIIPERRFVRDEARVAAGPVEFEGAMDSAAGPYGVFAEAHMPAAMAVPQQRGWQALAMSRRAPLIEDVMDSTAHVATGADLDELFEYQVGGVSVGRGESAMVSVAQHVAPYRRELLYNGEKHAAHPVVALRLRNETGLTLERGPVTVIEDGQYRGEAMLPFSKADAEIVLVYAVELGITVRETVSESTTTNSISLQGAYLHIAEHFDRRTEYTLTNASSRDEAVTLERRKWHGAELADTRVPDEGTAEHDRWIVPCKANAVTTFVVVERVLTQRQEAVLHEDLRPLAEYLQGRWLDPEARRVLQHILRLRRAATDAEERLSQLQAERADLGTRQDRLRKNLAINATNEAEGEIRRRSADEFRRTQDREDEIEVELSDVEDQREGVERELAELIAGLA
jgi:hypothetical protein